MNDVRVDDKRYADYIREECFTHDYEYDHKRADEILLEILEDLGYSETIEAFCEVIKHYA